MHKYYIIKINPTTLEMQVLKVIRADSIKVAREKAAHEYMGIVTGGKEHVAVLTRQRYLEAFDAGCFGSIGRNL